MPTPRRCRTHKAEFTPRRFRPWERQCERCRSHFFAPERADREPFRVGAVRIYRPGLLRDMTAVRSQASVVRNGRIDPSELDDDELLALRRRHLPTELERVEDDEQARRDHVLAFVATPTQAALVATLDTEGETP